MPTMRHVVEPDRRTEGPGRGHPDDQQELRDKPFVNYQTTKQGDVLVLDPQKKGHRRELSSHFFESTRITAADEPEHDKHDSSFHEPISRQPRPLSGRQDMQALPASGGKHRRGFSGDVSNPAVAHRRINSRGSSAPVDRCGYYEPSYFPPPSVASATAAPPHRREDCTPLDILSRAAATTGSKEDIDLTARRPRFHRTDIKHPPRTTQDPYDYRRAPVNYPPYHGPPPPHYSYHHTYYGHGVPPLSYHNTMPAQPHPDLYQSDYASLREPPFIPKSSPFPAPLPSQNKKAEMIERQFGKKSEWHEHPSRSTPSRSVHTFNSILNFGNENNTTMSAAPHRPLHHLPEDSESVPSAPSVPPTKSQHHRKSSSFSAFISNALVQDPSEGPRPTSSSSFGLDVPVPPDTFIFMETPEEGQLHHEECEQEREQEPEQQEQLHYQQEQQQKHQHHHQQEHHDQQQQLQPQKLAPPQVLSSSVPASMSAISPGSPIRSGGQMVADANSSPTAGTRRTVRRSRSGLSGTVKRARRKCTHEGCGNRVVQGGLCISHGAKRKTCKHPGCKKNVKKAGLCSTHGPARKRCEAEGCTKVAVQGGKCIAHGAKKKLCSIESCTKQAILGGMCKKHHDQTNGIVRGGRKVAPQVCLPVKKPEKPTHQRGLSIFQEMTPESVQSYLSKEGDGDIHPLKR